MSKLIIAGDCRSGALFNSDRSRRYALWRVWTAGRTPIAAAPRVRAPKRLVSVLEAIRPARLLVNYGTNPSDADEHDDDPTTHRVVKLARREGYYGVLLVNFASIVSSVHAPLLSAPDPCDSLNERALSTALALGAGEGVCLHLAAWGRVPGTLALARANMLDLAQQLGVALSCLGTNLDGSPRHLSARGVHRISDAAPLVPWARQDPSSTAKRPPRRPGPAASRARPPAPADSLLGARSDFSVEQRRTAMREYAQETAAMVRGLRDRCPTDEEYERLAGREFRAAWSILRRVFELAAVGPSDAPTYDFKLWRDAVAKSMGWLSGRRGASSDSWIRQRQCEAAGQTALFRQPRKGKTRS